MKEEGNQLRKVQHKFKGRKCVQTKHWYMLVSFIAELWHVVAYSAYMNTGQTNNFVYRAGQSTGKFIKGHLAYTSYADNLVSLNYVKYLNLCVTFRTAQSSTCTFELSVCHKCFCNGCYFACCGKFSQDAIGSQNILKLQTVFMALCCLSVSSGPWGSFVAYTKLKESQCTMG